MNIKYRLLIGFITICLILWKTLQYYHHRPNVSLEELKTEPKQLESNKDKIKVTVYYESLCSDSRNFILKQLLPTYSSLPDRITLDLVPYGKAKTIESSDDIKFECQHGNTECLGNKVHACVLHLVDDPMLQLKMVACMIDDGLIPLEVAERCAHNLGISYDEVWKCTHSWVSSSLLKTYGERTNDVQPAITFIPTIELDGSQKVPLPKILKDLKKELCNTYQDVPAGCPNT